MNTHWHLDSSLNPSINATAYDALRNLDACFAIEGPLVTVDPKSSVIKKELGADTFFIKRYTKAGKRLRRFLGRSRVRAEWENLQTFQALGIPTPELCAYGEERQGLQFIRGALVTRALTDACDLEHFIAQQPECINNREIFRQLAGQIARYTRSLHQAGFTHNDLDWRNILVTFDRVQHTTQVFFFDCPGGRFWRFPWPPAVLRYRIMKDLAHLDKLAREQLSLRQRLWFFKQYRGCRKISPDDRKLLSKIQNFYNADRYRRKWRF